MTEQVRTGDGGPHDQTPLDGQTVREGVPVEPRVRAAFWIEAALGAVSAMLAVLTIVWHYWIEAVFAWGPDRHNGAFEWELVAVCCLSTVLFAVLARLEWRSAAIALAAHVGQGSSE